MDTAEYTIEKTQIECFKIKGNNGSFATITLDYEDSRGRVSIASDFGNWSNYWGSCGSSFKQFLVGLDIHYAAGKFGEGDWFDLEATVKSLKGRIHDFTSD